MLCTSANVTPGGQIVALYVASPPMGPANIIGGTYISSWPSEFISGHQRTYDP
jgi:hypothetical protein